MHSTTPPAAEVSMRLSGDDVRDWGRLHHRPRIRAKHKRLVDLGGIFDRLTIVGMFAGLHERLSA